MAYRHRRFRSLCMKNKKKLIINIILCIVGLVMSINIIEFINLTYFCIVFDENVLGWTLEILGITIPQVWIVYGITGTIGILLFIYALTNVIKNKPKQVINT